MKPPFAFALRTRLAAWAMRQMKAFVASVAPWLAQPGDGRMTALAPALVLLLLACGLIFVGTETVAAIRELLPPSQREATP